MLGVTKYKAFLAGTVAAGLLVSVNGALGTDRRQDDTVALLDENLKPGDRVLETLLAPDDFPLRVFVYESRGDEAVYSLDASLGSSPPTAELHPERLPWPQVAGLELRAVNRTLVLKKTRSDVRDEDLDRGFSVRWVLKPLGQRFRPYPFFAVEVQQATVLSANGRTPLLRWQSPPPPDICSRDIKKGRPNCDLEGIGRDVRDLALSPDGSLLVLALGGLRPRIEIYNIRDIPRLRWQALFSPRSGGAVEVAFSTDGRWLVGLTGKGKLHRFAARSGGRHLSIPSSGQTAHTIPPGKMIAVAGEKGEVTFWYLRDGTIAWRLPPRGMRGTVDTLTASADGHRFATLEYTADQVYVRVWEMHRRAMLTEVAVAPYSISDIALDEHGENIYLIHEQQGLLKCPVKRGAKPIPFAGKAGARCRSGLRWLSPRQHISCSVRRGELQIDRRGNLVGELKTGIVSSSWQLDASTDGTRLAAAGSGHLLVWWLGRKEDPIGRVFQR